MEAWLHAALPKITDRIYFKIQQIQNKLIFDQHTIPGTEHHIIDPLIPTYFEIPPKNIVPTMAASADIHPTQAASANVRGPDCRGEAFDLKMGIDGEVQPIAHPFPMIQILTTINKHNYISSFA